MVIDKGKLVALLADKTGRSPEEVRENLEALSERIQEATESNRRFNIDGFGTFSKVEGEIYFEPSKKLQTEINQKYAGMEPIELMEPFKESGAGIPVEESEKPPPVTEDVFEEPEFVTEEREPRKEEIEAEETDDIPEKAPIPVAEEQAKPKQQPPAEDAGTDGEPREKILKEEKNQASEQEEEKPVVASTGNDRNTLGIILTAALLLIVLGLGAWWLYGSDFMQSASDNRATAPADTTQNDSEPVAGNTVENDSLMSSTAQENTVVADSVNQASANATPYGLRGSYNEETTEGYTLVVHSFFRRATVQSIADSLQQQNYRTVLFTGQANGQTRWRLGLGQFQTINDAREAVPELSEPYRQNYFIKRYNK